MKTAMLCMRIVMFLHENRDVLYESRDALHENRDLNFICMPMSDHFICMPM